MPHDDLCPATIADGRWRARCECDLIARVRADENMKVCRCGCMERDAHAEAVAARLVEVIVRQEYGLQQWHRATADVTYSLAQERDAARARTVEAEQKVIDAHREVALARAEVERITEDNRILREDAARNADMAQAWMEQRDAARAEVAALRKQEWAAPYRREVLADLREQVLMLEHDDSCSEIRQEAPCDCLRGSVLALIEEADRG